MANRWLEFFENEASGLSINRLNLFGAFIVTSGIMAALAFQEKMSEGYLTIYLTSFVASYAASRTADYKAGVGAPIKEP